jgi:hypothetical protein
LRRIARVAALAVPLTLTGAALSMGSAGSTETTPPAWDQLAAELDCPPGDLILVREGTHAPGGTGKRSARDALRDVLAREYPGLSADSFGNAGSDADSARFVRRRDTRAEAAAQAESESGGWRLELFVACDSTLDAARGRSG